MLSTQGAIAIAEICVYIPIFLLTLIIVFRHGFAKQLGWIYLSIFCVVRLAGAGFRIASDKNPDSSTDIEWASILQSVGLSPLLIASLGLLKRVTDEVSNHIRNKNADFAPQRGVAGLITKRATANSTRSRIIQLLHIPTVVALGLAIIGGVDESHTSAHDISNGKRFVKIAVIIFLGIYFALFALTVITIKDVGNAPKGEKRVLFAVLGALPFLAVRLLYSVLSAFSNNKDFSTAYGKPLINLFMGVIEEFIVVFFYTMVGLSVNNC